MYYPRSAAQVIRLLWSLPSDIIHLHIGGQLTGRLLALCLVCTMIPGKRVVLTFHSGGYPSWQRREGTQRFSFRNFVLRRLDAIIAVNTEIAELFRSLGVSPSRISVRCPYTPVAVSEDDQLPEPLRTFREAHRPLLTTVGLLEPEYDLALQVKALAGIRRELPRCRACHHRVGKPGAGAATAHFRGSIRRPHPVVRRRSASDNPESDLSQRCISANHLVRRRLDLGPGGVATWSSGDRQRQRHASCGSSPDTAGKPRRIIGGCSLRIQAPTARMAPASAPGSSDLDDLLALYRGLLPGGRRVAGESARTIS